MGRVAGKVALITGGASGLGLATAKLMAREGARIVITDIQKNKGPAAAKEIGGDTLFLEHDVTSEERWQQVVPVLFAIALSLALYAVPPAGREGAGFLLLAVTASLATLVSFPAFSYALDRISRSMACCCRGASSDTSRPRPAYSRATWLYAAS